MEKRSYEGKITFMSYWFILSTLKGIKGQTLEVYLPTNSCQNLGMPTYMGQFVKVTSFIILLQLSFHVLTSLLLKA
jgi:hypothetical protein